jgi:hypothetical protein
MMQYKPAAAQAVIIRDLEVTEGGAGGLGVNATLVARVEIRKQGMTLCGIRERSHGVLSPKTRSGGANSFGNSFAGRCPGNSRGMVRMELFKPLMEDKDDVKVMWRPVYSMTKIPASSPCRCCTNANP